MHPYQFVVAHAKDLTVSDVRVNDRKETPQPDRGTMYLHGVNGADIDSIRTCRCPDGLESVKQVGCEGIYMRG